MVAVVVDCHSFALCKYCARVLVQMQVECGARIQLAKKDTVYVKTTSILLWGACDTCAVLFLFLHEQQQPQHQPIFVMLVLLSVCCVLAKRSRRERASSDNQRSTAQPCKF